MYIDLIIKDMEKEFGVKYDDLKEATDSACWCSEPCKDESEAELRSRFETAKNNKPASAAAKQ